MSDDQPDLASIEQRLRPKGELEREIRALIESQLGGVLPDSPERGRDWYFNAVVLGGRSVDAYRVVRRYRTRTNLPALDLGSGVGSFVLMANLLDMPAIGVEPGSEELRLARARAAELGLGGDLFLAGTGERIPLADGAVSAVLLHDVLEHVPDWRAVLAECFRVLAPGGIVYVKGPSYAVRFFEPHYRLPWLPLMPRALARSYLSALGRDVDYFEQLGYRRRGAVLRELRSLGFALSFPRIEKLRDPASINRGWARRLVSLGTRGGVASRLVELAAENPLQSTIDVVGRKAA